MINPQTIKYLQKFTIWTRRVNINNLPTTRIYLRDVNYSRPDVALVDIIDWNKFESSKNFASPPTNVSFKLGKLSYNKFLQMFYEIVLHFNGWNVDKVNRKLDEGQADQCLLERGRR